MLAWVRGRQIARPWNAARKWISRAATLGAGETGPAVPPSVDIGMVAVLSSGGALAKCPMGRYVRGIFRIVVLWPVNKESAWQPVKSDFGREC